MNKNWGITVKLITFLFCFNSCTFSLGVENKNLKSSDDIYRWYVEGYKLDAQQVEVYQKTLANDAEDMKARIIIMSYLLHSKEVYSNSKVRDEFKENLIWLIKHYPDSEALDIEGFDLPFDFQRLNPNDYEEVKNLWIQQINKYPENTIVLRNASTFFMFDDKKRSETLLKKAKELEPKNPEWPDKLAHLAALSVNDETKKGKAPALEALAQEEKSTSLEKDEMGRFDKLADLANYAFKAGEDKKAEAYAEELLKLAPKHPKDWNYGNALFYGNTCLGRLALKKGDVGTACHYLIEAGKTPGSPQLNSFGPSMVLAKDLLEKNQKEAVLTFLKSCLHFWKMGQDRLNDWIANIEKGKTPTFDNLYL